MSDTSPLGKSAAVSFTRHGVRSGRDLSPLIPCLRLRHTAQPRRCHSPSRSHLPFAMANGEGFAAPFLQGMVQLRPPPPFDFDNPSSWPTWLLQHKDYSFATQLYAAPTEVQVRSMFYCMGPQARVVLASTTLGEADLKDVIAMKKAFTNHFVHPPNELYKSTRFHHRTQQPNEVANAFFTALRTMVGAATLLDRRRRVACSRPFSCGLARSQALGPALSKSAIVVARSAHAQLGSHSPTNGVQVVPTLDVAMWDTSSEKHSLSDEGSKNLSSNAHTLPVLLRAK